MLSSLLVALQTLTRIPVPSPRSRPDARMLAWSGALYPLVGAILGLVAMAVYETLAGFLPRSIVMLLIVALWALLTGALHEDGLADSADAFGSQPTREGILDVLKDSRVGTYGALALIFSVLIRWQALTFMPAGRTHFLLLASQVLPRAGMVAVGWWAGPATSGTGGGFAKSLGRRHLAAAWLVAAAMLAPFWSWQLLGLAAVSLIVAVVLSVYFNRRLGGVTGDCLGAVNQLQEIGILVAALWPAGF